MVPALRHAVAPVDGRGELVGGFRAVGVEERHQSVVLVPFHRGERSVVQRDGAGVARQQADDERVRLDAEQARLGRIPGQQIRRVGHADIARVPRGIDGNAAQIIEAASTQIGQVNERPAIRRDRRGKTIRVNE